MAIVKEIQTKSGITVSYWKITDWKINQSNKSIDIILTPYISSETRDEGYDPVRDEVRKVRAIDFITKNQPELNLYNYTNYFSPAALEEAASQGKTIYNIMYDYVKEHSPEFQGAVDFQ